MRTLVIILTIRNWLDFNSENGENLANWYPKTGQFPSLHHGTQVRYRKP